MNRWILLPLLVTACASKEPSLCITNPLCPDISGGQTFPSDDDDDDDDGDADATDTEPVTTQATDPTTSPDPSNASLPDTDPSSDPSTTEPDPTVPDPSTTNPDPSTTEPDPTAPDPSTTSPDPSDTDGPDYGQCGWVAGNSFYGCPAEGATPGAVDPGGTPIGCTATYTANGPCGALTDVGCCAPGGNNYYCAAGLVVEQVCGA